MFELTRRNLSGLLFGSLVAASARAESPVAPPRGKTILTISGHIDPPGGGTSATFDMAQIEALGTEGFETTTPWYSGPVRFDGVSMSHLMKEVGATGKSVTAVALNDYTTDLPLSDFETYNVILAIKRDGNYMPVRDKGPLFIVYPYDSAPELKAQRYYSRSAWQVNRLIVV